ncbi:AI-2E family transporter [Rhodothermus marinus]|uniref:AI-2E family transporter n=1 Tax=Rhodothermus marinus TaxID=29549 RepID=UPI0012BA50CD|nr:AI-2E family transporter [Rhodothermus marinus]BBM68893.1 AI-2E family transporter [Rhodothermus marinus]BBM71871.1 AI-2E family transporter [Rhodothermus marinus]
MTPPKFTPNDLEEPRLGPFETLLLGGGLALFLALLYEMREFLNPPLIAIAATILLWPLRRYRSVRALLLSGGFLLLFWLLSQLRVVLIPFVVAYLLAYLSNPLVDLLERRLHVPRWVSALTVTVLVVGALAAILLLLIPTIVGQLVELIRQMLNSVGELRRWLYENPLLDRLEEVLPIDRQALIQQFTTFLQQQLNALTQSLPDALATVAQSIGSLLGALTVLAILPMLIFYTLKDYPKLRDALISLFPKHNGRRDYLMYAGTVVGNYLRGQLLISLIAAFNVSVALLIFDVPFGLLIGLLAGVLNLIPNLGAVLTNIIALLIALLFGDPPLLDAVIVTGVLLGQGLLEASVLSPHILSHQVGLHPVLILLSLFVFGYFLGAFGLLIAVPTTAILVGFYQSYREAREKLAGATTPESTEVTE